MDDIPDIPNDDTYFEYSSREYHSELLRFLSESNDMKQALKGSIKQGLYSFAGTVAGGLLLGPAGALAGSLIGAGAGYARSEDYDGIIVAVSELDEEHRAVSFENSYFHT